MESDAVNKLSSEYQILTELHRSGDTRTYLARHLQLNRDVTITVVDAGGGDRSFLNAFAADVETLRAQQHPNVIPVVDGRWLDDAQYAVVRARVRGSTLDQTVSAVGAMPQPRIASALREVSTALAWAKSQGIAHRHVSPESLVFQQGTGRVLLAFEPSRRIASDDETIRQLAATMSGGAPVNVAEYSGMLAPAAVPVADRVVATPVAKDDSVVVVQRAGMSFGARVFTTFAVVAALVVAAVLFLGRRDQTNVRVATTSENDAAGDVAPARTDTAINYPTPVIVNEPTPLPAPPPPMPRNVPVNPPPSASPYPYPSYPTATPPLTTQPPVVRTPAPEPPVTRPAPTPAPTPVDTVVRPPVSTDPCDSPAGEDQRRCLSSAIDRNDSELNSVYQRLINALRKQANVGDTDPDPSSVEELRSTQRRWLQDRDDVCSGTGAGLLYARDRAACFAARSAARTRELRSQLEAIPSGLTDR
jgi:uncharacterized protein YecT (DUF1311 family)